MLRANWRTFGFVVSKLGLQGWPTARTYFFEDSATCDANMEICRCSRSLFYYRQGVALVSHGVSWYLMLSCMPCRSCDPSPTLRAISVCYPTAVTSASRLSVRVRVFSYAYRTAITTAAAQTVAPFAAIKITALLEPKAMVCADFHTPSVSRYPPLFPFLLMRACGCDVVRCTEIFFSRPPVERFAVTISLWRACLAGFGGTGHHGAPACVPLGLRPQTAP